MVILSEVLRDFRLAYEAFAKDRRGAEYQVWTIAFGDIERIMTLCSRAIADERGDDDKIIVPYEWMLVAISLRELMQIMDICEAEREIRALCENITRLYKHVQSTWLLLEGDCFSESSEVRRIGVFHYWVANNEFLHDDWWRARWNVGFVFPWWNARGMFWRPMRGKLVETGLPSVEQCVPSEEERRALDL